MLEKITIFIIREGPTVALSNCIMCHDKMIKNLLQTPWEENELGKLPKLGAVLLQKDYEREERYWPMLNLHTV